MMKFLSHLLALLLATALSLGVSNFILNRTIWSAPFLETRADKTQLYDHLATGIPAAFLAANPDESGGKLPIIDPALIRGQVTTILPQFIDHLHNGGPAPTVDLAALAAATGQPAPADATPQPVGFGTADPQILDLIRKLRPVADFALLGALALAGLIVVTMRERRLPTLARAAYETTGTLALSAGVALLVPSLITQALSKPSTISIRDAISGFLSATAQGIATQFAIAAAVFLALGLALTIARGTSRLKSRFAKPLKPTSAPFPGTSRF